MITSGGIVLAGTFAALGTLPLVFITEIGFAVAFGVLLDTFIVRSVLVTTLNLDIGRWIWPQPLHHNHDLDLDLDQPQKEAAELTPLTTSPRTSLPARIRPGGRGRPNSPPTAFGNRSQVTTEQFGEAPAAATR